MLRSSVWFVCCGVLWCQGGVSLTARAYVWSANAAAHRSNLIPFGRFFFFKTASSHRSAMWSIVKHVAFCPLSKENGAWLHFYFIFFGGFHESLWKNSKRRTFISLRAAISGFAFKSGEYVSLCLCFSGHFGPLSCFLENGGKKKKKAIVKVLSCRCDMCGRSVLVNMCFSRLHASESCWYLPGTTWVCFLITASCV